MTHISQKSKEIIDFYIAIGAWIGLLCGLMWFFREVILPIIPM